MRVDVGEGEDDEYEEDEDEQEEDEQGSRTPQATAGNAAGNAAPDASTERQTVTSRSAFHRRVSSYAERTVNLHDPWLE